MSERLRPRDLAVLAVESPSAPRHNATVEIFDPATSGFDYARLVELVDDRITFVPRYRQRIATVPGHVANPVWVDDPDFDLGYHVRRSALPRPGTRRPALRAGVPDHRAPARPAPAAVGGLLHRGARGGPGRRPLQVPRGAGRRGAHGRPGAGAARPFPRPAADAPRRLATALRAVADGAARRRPPGRHHRSLEHPRVGPGVARLGPTLGGRARESCGGHRGRAEQPAAGRRPPARRAAVAAAPGRHRPHGPGGLPGGTRPSTAAPSTTSSSPPSPAHCAAGCSVGRSR